MEVSAKVGKDGTPHSVQYDFGDDLDAMVKRFGAAIVHDKARANMAVGLQSVIRTAIDDGKKGMENALRTKPLEVKEQYERQLSDLQQAYGEAMLELRARKKLASLLGNEDEK